MSLLHELTRVECGKLDEDGMNRTLWSVVVREGFLGLIAEFAYEAIGWCSAHVVNG